jgi:palmitoyl-protein thioesterase
MFLGDSCCFPFSLGYLKKLVEKELNNTIYVKSFEIGGNYFRDYESSYFIHPNKQVSIDH